MWLEDPWKNLLRAGKMGDLSKHFSRYEFACRCGCGFNTVDTELITILADLRIHFKQPITVNSGARCENYNMLIGGESSSQHLLGRAADITIKDTPPRVVQFYLLEKYTDRYGIGQYADFSHIDSRSKKARWG